MMASCTGQQKTMKKYEWRPTANAPKYYAAEIVSGNFYMEDGSSIYIPKGHTLMTGWGKTGAAHIVGEDLKPVPHKFDIKWVSYLEEKFYGGTFQLPKEKMEALFEKGYLDENNEKDNYSSIVLGLAPGGVITVWMLAAGSTVEIDRFQASEVEVTEKEFIPYANLSVAQYVKETKDDIINDDIKGAIDVSNIPFGIWDTYRKKYPWTPSINFKSEGKTDLYAMGFEFFNGEEFYTHPVNDDATANMDRPIPKAGYLRWKDANNNKFGAKIFFDEKEIFQHFETIFEKEKASKAIVLLEIDKYNSNLEACMVAKEKKYPITKARIKVYEASR
ncbi:hypothetical protein AB832_04520 [Flavobacteriaceae bacterium (ex Bugula neritina AB1)]|nr:hypothetical protein AB832_04520 [Flavobacteriaceae bacterium (ex Bugula neritina AB1)]